MVTSPNYSGESAGVGMVRGGGEKATQALKEYGLTVLEADKFKYTERKKEESAFLEAIKTKPEFVISAKAREDQAKALTDFNQRYAPLIKKGYLTMEEKTAMANDRAALEAMQQQQLAHYQQYLGMKEAMLKDTQGRFDKDEFRQWEEDYQQSGQFDHATMPLQGANPYLFLRNNPVKGTESYDEKTNSILSGTPAEAQNWIRQQAYTSEIFRIGLIKEFQALSPSDKTKYLDTDKSGTVSPQEAQAGQGVDATNPDNPILKYALEKYTKDAIKTDAYKGKAKTGGAKPTAQEKMGKKQVQVANTTVYISPGRRETNPVYGDTTYSPFSFRFGDSVVHYGIPTVNFKRITGTSTNPDPAKGNVNGRLRLYDPQKHVLLIELVGSSESSDTGSGDLIEIPEANFQGFENIPVMMGNEVKSIGDLYDLGKKPDNLTPQEAISKGQEESKTTAPTATPTKGNPLMKR